MSVPDETETKGSPSGHLLYMPALSDRRPADQVVIWPEERLEAVLEVIQSAERRLLLSIFKCNEPRVLRALSDARRRGVTIEAILTPRASGRRRKLRRLRKKLVRLGVMLHEQGEADAKYHAKYLVADSRVALIGSLNFTKKCFRRSCDFLFRTTNPELVDGVERIFAHDTRPARSRSKAFPELPTRLVVAPDGARARVAALLTSARQRIAIIDPKLTDDEMIGLLRMKILEGVQVEVLGQDEVGTFASHGKLLIVDDAIAMIGSLSMSPAGLEQRRELAALVTDRPSIAALNEFFRMVADSVPTPEADLEVAFC